MASNTQNLPFSVQTLVSEAEDLVYIPQSLTADTANIIGISHKGRAFVPTSIYSNAVQTQFESVSIGEDVKTFIVSNTIDNALGSSRQNRFSHLYDEFTCYVPSKGRDTTSMWLNNGGINSTFTRVLGIGNGKINTTTGKRLGSGFNVSKNTPDISLDHKIADENPHAIANGESGCVTFLIEKGAKFVSEFPIDSTTTPLKDSINYYEESGLSTNSLLLRSVIFTPKGVLPSTVKINGSSNYSNTIVEENNATSIFTKKKNNLSEIHLNGFQLNSKVDVFNLEASVNKFNLGNRNLIFKNDNIKDVELVDGKPILNKNYFNRTFKELGHLVYADFSQNGLYDNLDSLDTSTSFYSLLRTKEYSLLNDSSLPDYNSFESEYTTAKTPWITSQPINRNSLKDNREQIHDHVVELFRFYSNDDGEVGNRFRIKINPVKRGSYDNDSFAAFDLYIFEYDPRDNSFEKLSAHLGLNLNPKSEKYIARVIGTEHVYCNLDSNKIISEGLYPQRNKYLRIEMNPKIEEMLVERQQELIPSGFNAYPHIQINANAFSDYFPVHDDYNENTKIYQIPVSYNLNFYKDAILGDSTIQNNWGATFTTSRFDESKSGRLLPMFDDFYNVEAGEEIKNKISPHYFYTKYFLSNTLNSNLDVWVEDKNYLNSFFHLEKILVYKNESGDIVSLNDNDKFARYKKSGKKLNDIAHHFANREINGYEYLNLDDESIWDSEDNKLIPVLADCLSFDLFMYGGFDGTNILDKDKKYLNNNSLIREIQEEESGSNINGATLNAYKKAIDIATDRSNCSGDILVIPGIRELPIIRKCINIAEDNKDFIFLSDISGTITGNNIIFSDSTNTDLFKTIGIIGNHFVLDIENNKLGLNYIKDSESLRVFSKAVTDTENYSYKEILNKQFDLLIENFKNLQLDSRYLFSTFGETTGSNGLISKVISPESLALLKMARQIKNSILINEVFDIDSDFTNVNPQILIDNKLDFSSIDTNTSEKRRIDLLNDSIRISKLNLVVRKISTDPVQFNTNYSSYLQKGTVFDRIDIVRSILSIKKRVKFDMFRNSNYANGGLLFANNHSLLNLYDRAKVQLDSLCNDFVAEGLISNYLVDIPRREDKQTILDIQDYKFRGKIVLQIGSSDIIELDIDNILNDLVLLSSPTGSERQIILPVFK